MKTMCGNQVSEFLDFMENRIENHHINIANASLDHRGLIKTERAEAGVILKVFLKILNDKN
jgi:hypothetical protein